MVVPVLLALPIAAKPAPAAPGGAGCLGGPVDILAAVTTGAAAAVALPSLQQPKNKFQIFAGVNSALGQPRSHILLLATERSWNSLRSTT